MPPINNTYQSIVQVELGDLIPGCRNFHWHEFLRLPQWQIFVMINQAQFVNICQIARKFQWVRDFYERPITITSGFRPLLYNEFIGGAKESWHTLGAAGDGIVSGVPSEQVREDLSPKLDDFRVRMESNETPHFHLDLGWLPGGQNFFRA